MVAVMEVKADRKGRYWEDIEGCGPTAAEIETLRKGVRLNATPDERRAACDLVDRLSPPAPEVDEATRIWREMMAVSSASASIAAEYRRGLYDVGGTGPKQIPYLRTALSELIASKDAEIERQAQYLSARDNQISILKRAARTDAEVISAAESELAALRAENERLVKERDYLLECNGRSFVRAERLEDMMEAAERNTAEPKKRYSFEECSIENGWVDFTKPATSATDTTPEVVVTQTARDIASGIMKERGLKRSNGYAYTIALQAAAEAEARGRWLALEKVLNMITELREQGYSAGWTLDAVETELKRQSEKGNSDAD